MMLLPKKKLEKKLAISASNDSYLLYVHRHDHYIGFKKNAKFLPKIGKNPRK
jgi:hypothetical protein